MTLNFKTICLCLLISMIAAILFVGCHHQKNSESLQSVIVGEDDVFVVAAEYNSEYATKATFEITCLLKNKSKDTYYLDHGTGIISYSIDGEAIESIAIGKRELISGESVLSEVITLNTADVINHKVTLNADFKIVEADGTLTPIQFSKDIVF